MSKQKHLRTPRVPLLRAGKATLLLLALSVLVHLVFTGLTPPRRTAYAAASTNLNFQMRLLNAAGSIVPDGDYNIEFKLYDDDDTGTALWTETRTGTDKVRVVNGYATASLGSVTAFGATINWQEELWLTINIGGTGTADWDGEMNPRMKVTAVPFAFRAGELAKTEGGITNKLQFATPSGSDKTILLPNASGTVAVSASGNIALDSAGNITFTGQLPVASGGTGAATAQDAINNLAGLTTNGDLLYHNGTNVVRLARGMDGECLNSTATTLQWGSCGTNTSGFTDDGTLVRLTGASDRVTIGSASDLSAKLAVDGAADEIQFLIQGYSTQNTDLLVVEDSAGADLFKVTGEGDVSAAGNTLYVDASANRVGIGRNDPGYSLDVVGDARIMNGSGPTQLFLTPGEDQVASIYLGEEDSPTSGPAIQADNSNGYLYIKTSGQPALTIDNFTNVGIGRSSSISARLDVLGATSGSVDALRVSNNTSSGDIAEFYDDTTLIAKFHDGGAVTIDSGNFTVGAASTAGTLALMSGTGNSASLSAASLGVGLLLQDSGMTAGVTGGGLQITSGAAANDADAAAFLAGATTNDHSTYTARSTHASGIFMQDGKINIFANQSLTAGNSFTPFTRLTVDNNGRIGIGDTSPAYQLTVGSGDEWGVEDGNIIWEGATNNAFETILTVVDPTADITYRLPDAAAGTYDICTTAGNCSGYGGVTTIGTINSQTKSANGAVISGTSLYLQTADATNVGLVSTGAQSFGGDKTFNGRLKVGSGGTVDYATGNGSLYVQNNLEVDGDVDFGDNFYINSTTGVLHLNSFANMSSGSYAMVELLTTGTQFYRDRADDGTALTVRQDNASSTGHILDLHNDVGSVLHVKQTGELVLSSVSGAGLTDCDAAGSFLQYDSSTKQFVCASGSGGATHYYRYKSSDETRNQTSSPAIDSELAFTAGTNEEWIIEGYIDMTVDQASLNGSYKVAVIAPAGSTCQMIFTDPDRGDIGTHNYYESTSCGSPTGPGNSSYGGVINQRYKFTASVKTGGTGGTVGFGWSNYYSNPGYDATVHAGSTLVAFKDTGADLAELYNSTDMSVGSGDVMMFDRTLPAGVKKAVGTESQLLAGVVATNPADIYSDKLNARNLNTKMVPVALIGRVPVKASNENGEIKAGDLLAASDTTPGVAVKATKAGYMIGRALEDFTEGGSGMVLAFVNTHYGEPEQAAVGSGRLQQELDLVIENYDQLTQSMTDLHDMYQSMQADLEQNKQITGQITQLLGMSAQTEDQVLEAPTTDEPLMVINDLKAVSVTVEEKVTTKLVEVTEHATVAALEVIGNTIINGTLAVRGDAEVANITIAGHVRSRGGQPKVERPAELPPEVEFTVDGTDTVGTITIKTGANEVAADELARVVFNSPYRDRAPRVLFVPGDEASQKLSIFANQREVDQNGFKLRLASGAKMAANSEYLFNYYVVETLSDATNP